MNKTFIIQERIQKKAHMLSRNLMCARGLSLMISFLIAEITIAQTINTDSTYNITYTNSEIKTKIKSRFQSKIYNGKYSNTFKETYGSVPYMFDYPIILTKIFENQGNWEFYSYQIEFVLKKLKLSGDCKINKGDDNNGCFIGEALYPLNDSLFRQETKLTKTQITNGFVAFNRVNRQVFIISAFIGRDSPFEPYTHLLDDGNNDKVIQFVQIYYSDYNPVDIVVNVINYQRMEISFYSDFYKKNYKAKIHFDKKKILLK